MQATFDLSGSVVLRNPQTGYRYVIGREDERYMRVAAAVARNVLEMKDASGHEHDDKGLFSSGSGGKAKHGERATKAHAAYHDLMAKAKAARIDAFNEVKKDAESASNDADESAKKANEVLNDTPIWDDYDDGEEGLNFEDFENLLNNWDSSASANERFESLKEIERMAKQTSEITEFRDGDTVLADDKVAEIRKQMKHIVAYCRDARQHLKTYVKHRREMRAIKAGEVMEVQESLDADDDEIGVDLLENFTGIDSHGHQWVNGKQVKRTPAQEAHARNQEQQKKSPEKSAELTHEAKAEGIIEKYKGKLTEAVDSIPGGKLLREKAAQAHEKIKERYGEKAAAKIMASAVAISWGAFIAGPIVGYPNYVPISVAMLPAIAIAELHYRLKGKGDA